MSRPFTVRDGLHRDSALSVVLEKIGSDYYFAVTPVRPSTPTITTVTTTDANWTALATGLTGILHWKICELNGGDIHYAFVAAPGDNFSIAYGVTAEDTGLTDIYIKRPATNNITVKLEYWTG